MIRKLCAVLFFTLFVQTIQSASAQPTIRWSFGGNVPSASPSLNWAPPNNLRVINATVAVVNSVGGIPAVGFGSLSPSQRNDYSQATGAFWRGNASQAGVLNLQTSSYFSIILTPPAGHCIVLRDIGFGAKASGLAPTSFTIRTSGDNFMRPVVTGALGTVWRYQRTSGAVLGNLGNQAGAPVEIRIYTYGGTATPLPGVHNVTIDDISLIYNAVPADQAR